MLTQIYIPGWSGGTPVISTLMEGGGSRMQGLPRLHEILSQKKSKREAWRGGSAVKDT